ncbi:MAG: thioredoxin domain-containing protein [Methanomassiliicoccales archaeon]|nr:thioredoxin domain-containing protein [Methanomassiliicoccales archaeon]
MSPNHLVNEKSLYLRQHATNPVDWYPWGEEAFDKASREDKPIFLSIGYSACHWCHVMARESFSDEDVAKVLNRDFVCIKVDREERPDIDSIYMTACQMLTGSGGWPLSIVITPDRKPFFATSYIPRRSLQGSTGIIDLMTQLSDAWKNDRATVLRTVEAVYQALAQFADRLEPHELKGEVIDLAYQSLLKSYDQIRTGFDHSPKFPSAHRLMFLIDRHSRTGEDMALQMALNTLRRMRQSGLFDHVGLGFFRYSTDGAWHLPHFEKTLYDQAMMSLAYAAAFSSTNATDMRDTAEMVLAYAERSLASPQGLFYSAESADSEGKEGKFYLWTFDELRRLLAPQEFDLIRMAFNIKEEGNFYDEASQMANGSNLLDIIVPIPQAAEAAGLSEADAIRLMKKSLGRMFDEREKRVHPDKDDKALTDWNGIMIAAFAHAARVFKEQRHLAIARRAADGIWLMMQRDGRLHHRSIGGEVAIEGFLDDYSHFVWGLLEVYRASNDRKYLDWAIGLTETVLVHFSDAKGGFFQTDDSSEEMIVRMKEAYDGAIPSGNSVMAMDLVTLGVLTGESKYSEAAEKIFEAFATDIESNPAAYAHLLSAFSRWRRKGRLLALIGADGEEAVVGFQAVAREHYDPDLEIIRYGNIQEIPESLREGITSLGSEPRSSAYLCSGTSCEPIRDPSELEKVLASRQRG